MIKLCIALLIFSSTDAYSRKLNFLESQLFRIAAANNSMRAINPFYLRSDFTSAESNLHLGAQEKTYALYQDLQSKDQNKIEERLSESYGNPYDASAKLNLGYRMGNFTHFFSTNAGAALLVTDPVFPEMKGILFHDYTTSMQYTYHVTPQFLIMPQLNLGVRKTLDQQLTVADLVQRSLDMNFNKRPYLGFSEFSLLSVFGLSGLGQILFELNSFPIQEQKYSYWDSFLGYQTPSLINSYFLSDLKFYAGYSPFYGGQYDVSRTYKWGTELGLLDLFKIHFFAMDKNYLSSIFKIELRYLDLEFFTVERAYDDFDIQKSRHYGLNLRFKIN